jgi:hypothetical protein
MKKISGALFKELKIGKVLKRPQLIRDSMVITKEQLNMEFGVIKYSWEIQFSDLMEFMEDEIKGWLVAFVNKN